MMVHDTRFDAALELLIVVLCISLVVCFVRLYRGPNPPNRVVSFDLIAIHTVGILAIFAIRNDVRVLLDVAIVTAVLGFLGTVMLSFFLERSDGSDWYDTPDDQR